MPHSYDYIRMKKKIQHISESAAESEWVNRRKYFVYIGQQFTLYMCLMILSFFI